MCRGSADAPTLLRRCFACGRCRRNPHTNKQTVAQGHLDEVQELKRGGTKLTGARLGWPFSLAGVAQRARTLAPKGPKPRCSRRVCVCGIFASGFWTPRRGRSPTTGRIRCLAAQRQASQRHTHGCRDALCVRACVEWRAEHETGDDRRLVILEGQVLGEGAFSRVCKVRRVNRPGPLPLRHALGSTAALAARRPPPAARCSPLRSLLRGPGHQGVCCVCAVCIWSISSGGPEPYYRAYQMSRGAEAQRGVPRRRVCVCKQVVEETTQRQFAMKRMAKTAALQCPDHVFCEQRITRNMAHPFCIRQYASFQVRAPLRARSRRGCLCRRRRRDGHRSRRASPVRRPHLGRQGQSEIGVGGRRRTAKHRTAW